MGELKADSLGYPMNSDGTMIRVRYDVIPDGVDPMIYCYRQNTKHGLRPSAEDTKRVVEAYYESHPGCPARFFAEQLQISQKAAEKYVRCARVVWRKERDRLIRELSKAGHTQQGIAKRLQEKWPDSQVSQALVSQVLSQTSTERQVNKVSRPRGGIKPTSVPKDGQSSEGGNVREVERIAPETSTQSVDHPEKLSTAPSAFSFIMTRRGCGQPDESFEFQINELGSLRPDQYEAINYAVGQLEKICKEIENEPNEAKVQHLSGESAEEHQPSAA